MSAKDKASTTASDSPTGGGDKDARTSEEIKAKQAAPDSAGEGVEQAQQFAQANPVPLAIGGAFLAGFVLGRILSR